ncbi:unnamed protein product [Paramecium sonneborni]|uniref:Uncharacterized protein n=1 Tax=Paramecium sonneborni TaxID=65129 RepID=A0A8S1KH86_9CILI|nr:unnamed protein product [Paramecium sonneborni]
MKDQQKDQMSAFDYLYITEEISKYHIQSFRQVPIIKPKKISDNPFYALTMHKRKTTPKLVQTMEQNQQVTKAFPKREFKHKMRSRTITDNSSIELPKIIERKWEPKKAHMYYNLNFLIQQTKRGLKTIHY